MNNWIGQQLGGIHNQGLVYDEITGENIAVVYDHKNTVAISLVPRMIEALNAAAEELEYLKHHTSIKVESNGQYIEPDESLLVKLWEIQTELEEQNKK
jgi:hypothetical protein